MSPAIVRVPERVRPLLLATRNETTPLLLLVDPDVIAIHEALLWAFHAHPLLETATLASVAPAGSNWSSGAIAKRQGAASWTTRIRVSLMTISPSRVDAIGLVAALNSTFPLPCPAAGDASETQPAGVVTLQAHSGAAVIEIVPVPPSAAICARGVALSWHLTRVGPVGTAVVLDVPQLTMLTTATAKTMNRTSGRRGL